MPPSTRLGKACWRAGWRPGAFPHTGRPRIIRAPGPPVRLTLGGVPAELQFVAAAPHAVAGLMQINFRVPWNAPVGDAVPLVLTVGGSSSSTIATMAVRAVQDQVLVVTDDVRLRQLWTLALKGAGYGVFTAHDEEEAEAQARAHPLDLVVMDLQSANRDWQASIATMRAERSRLKLIAAVTSLRAEDLRSADILDAQAVIERSVTPQALLHKVREVIQRRRPIYDGGEPWPLPTRPVSTPAR